MGGGGGTQRWFRLLAENGTAVSKLIYIGLETNSRNSRNLKERKFEAVRKDDISDPLDTITQVFRKPPSPLRLTKYKQTRNYILPICIQPESA